MNDNNKSDSFNPYDHITTISKACNTCNFDSNSTINCTPINRKVSVRKTGNCSYVDLITNAILASPEQQLTANEIYECLVHNINLDHSPSSLKNTIRHTLSWYKRFKRVQRGTLQKPAWWTVDLSAEPSKKNAIKQQQYCADSDTINVKGDRLKARDGRFPRLTNASREPPPNEQPMTNNGCIRSKSKMTAANSPITFLDTVPPFDSSSSEYVESEYYTTFQSESEYSSYYSTDFVVHDNNTNYRCYSNDGYNNKGTAASSSSDISQMATVITDRGAVCDLDLPDPLPLKMHTTESKETQTKTSNYNNFAEDDHKRYRCEVNFVDIEPRGFESQLFCRNVAFARRGDHGGQLRVAPLPADLASLDVVGSEGLECDIVRVLQHEIDLEGKFDLDCLNNFKDS